MSERGRPREVPTGRVGPLVTSPPVDFSGIAQALNDLGQVLSDVQNDEGKFKKARKAGGELAYDYHQVHPHLLPKDIKPEDMSRLDQAKLQGFIDMKMRLMRTDMLKQFDDLAEKYASSPEDLEKEGRSYLKGQVDVLRQVDAEAASKIELLGEELLQQPVLRAHRRMMSLRDQTMANNVDQVVMELENSLGTSAADLYSPDEQLANTAGNRVALIRLQLKDALGEDPRGELLLQRFDQKARLAGAMGLVETMHPVDAWRSWNEDGIPVDEDKSLKSLLHEKTEAVFEKQLAKRLKVALDEEKEADKIEARVEYVGWRERFHDWDGEDELVREELLDDLLVMVGNETISPAEERSLTNQVLQKAPPDDDASALYTELWIEASKESNMETKKKFDLHRRIREAVADENIDLSTDQAEELYAQMKRTDALIVSEGDFLKDFQRESGMAKILAQMGAQEQADEATASDPSQPAEERAAAQERLSDPQRAFDQAKLTVGQKVAETHPQLLEPGPDGKVDLVAALDQARAMMDAGRLQESEFLAFAFWLESGRSAP